MMNILACFKKIGKRLSQDTELNETSELFNEKSTFYSENSALILLHYKCTTALTFDFPRKVSINTTVKECNRLKNS